MLHEILYVKQERKKDKRRWFTDDYWDLYVWNRQDGSYSGFQLCYGKPNYQRALTWMEDGGPVHAGVSEGNNPHGFASAGYLSSPLLVADGTLEVRPVAQRFWKDSRKIDPEVRRHVILKLKELMASERSSVTDDGSDGLR